MLFNGANPIALLHRLANPHALRAIRTRSIELPWVLMRCFVAREHNCKHQYENCDRDPDPSPDTLLNVESHRFTLTVQFQATQFAGIEYRQKKRLAIRENL
jgi:hypothetical protein